MVGKSPAGPLPQQLLDLPVSEALKLLTPQEQRDVADGRMSMSTALRLLQDQVAPAAFIDELDELLHTRLDQLVAEYLPTALKHGTTEDELRAWLSDDTLLDYPATAAFFGVKSDTLRQWVHALNKAVAAGEPPTSTCFMKPDVSEGKVRQWRRNRCVLHGWRNGKLVPGTLIPIPRKGPGRNPSGT